MATQEDYEIGSTSSTTKLTALATPVNPPRGEFNEWSELYWRADGIQTGHGYPRARWVFDWLTQAMITQLRTFCAAGSKSAVAYIVTRRYDGTFVKYSSVMHWPEDQLTSRAGGAHGDRAFYENISIEFTKLEAV